MAKLIDQQPLACFGLPYLFMFRIGLADDAGSYKERHPRFTWHQPSAYSPDLSSPHDDTTEMSSSSDESERISEFQSITGSSDAEARSFLEAHNWDLTSAIMMFFDTTQPRQSPQPQGHPQPSSMGPMVEDDDDDDDDDESWQPMVPPIQSST